MSEHVGRFGPDERSDRETQCEHVGRFGPDERSDQETQ